MEPNEPNWCAGLHITRSRPLTVSELGRIRSRRRWLIARALLSLVGIPVVLILFVAATAIPAAPEDSFISIGAVIPIALGIFLGIPLCIAVANDYFKRAGVLKRQSRSSKVLVCEGVVGDVVAKPSDLRRIVRLIGDDSEVVLEVLRESGLVWAINGRPQESWIVVPRVRIANTPERARLAAQYVRPVQTEDGTFRLHQRLLSEEERLELQDYLPRRFLIIGVVALWVNAAAAPHVVLYGRHHDGVPLIPLLLLAGAFWCDTHLVFGIRRRRRLRTDLREGFVVIYQSDPSLTASQETVVEFLPYSGAEWTTGGRPAPWRRLFGTVAGG